MIRYRAKDITCEVCRHFYLVWVGVSRTHESLVLVEQEPELTVKLRLV